MEEAYRHMALLGPTVIIGDFNAAPRPLERGGQDTPEDVAVRDTMDRMQLRDLTEQLTGQPSHYPNHGAPSHIDLCHGDPTVIGRVKAKYGPLTHRDLGL